MKGWTQKMLGPGVKRIFPFAAASQSTITRIENRGKLVTERIAMEFGRAFGVDPGLCMPHSEVHQSKEVFLWHLPQELKMKKSSRGLKAQ